jgi:hypothetical protein
MTFDEAKRILGALEQEGVRYVLVGSMAMAAQGLVRATRDMDFFVAPDAENVDRLRRALRRVFGADPNLEQITAEDLGGDYPAIEYIPPEGGYSLDILSRLGEVFRYDQIDAEDLVVDGIRVRVATPRMLYRMKRDTVRPLDRIDAEAIRERFDLGEEE